MSAHPQLPPNIIFILLSVTGEHSPFDLLTQVSPVSKEVLAPSSTTEESCTTTNVSPGPPPAKRARTFKETEQGNGVPKKKVKIHTNTVFVPFYCYTFEYFSLKSEEDCSEEANEEGSDMKEGSKGLKTSKSKWESIDMKGKEALILSNSVLAGILKAITDGYIEFKNKMLAATPWLDDVNLLTQGSFCQDRFFVDGLIGARDAILRSPHGPVSLWSPSNIAKHLVGLLPENAHDVATLIRNIHAKRVIGFSARMDERNERVIVLVYHNKRGAYGREYISGRPIPYGYHGDNDDAEYTSHSDAEE